MDRRTFMKWAIYALNGLFGVVLGVPVVAYVLDPRHRPAPPGGFRTVAKLSDLEINKPKEIVIRETRRDAWTLIPDDVVGRVWLVRRPNENGQPKVDCFNTTCPHLGCAINFTGTDFLCPCHGARFTLAGERVQPGNPAPHGMYTFKFQPEIVSGETFVQIDFNPKEAGDAEKRNA